MSEIKFKSKWFEVADVSCVFGENVAQNESLKMYKLLEAEKQSILSKLQEFTLEENRKRMRIMSQLMNDIMETANSFAENFIDKGNFDYSIKSLAEVDDLLEEMSDYAIDEDTIYDMYTMVGSYVFETARRNYGGRYYWMQDEEQPILVAGEPDFSVAIKAWEKVKGRLENGEEDNIPFYIEGYREHVEQGKNQKGYTAIVV